MFADPIQSLSSATNPGTSLPLLDPKSLNFDEGIKVVNRTNRFIIPIPALKDGGEPLIYPSVSPKAGEAIKALDDNTPERGVVFFNGKDQSWQAVRGNGKEAILANDVTRDQAEALMSKLNELGGTNGISLEGVKSLLDFARNNLSIVDFYNKKLDGVTSDMSVIDPSQPLHMAVTKPTIHSAVYVRDGFTFDGPVKQIYPNGAVILNDGKYTWGIDSGVFQRNFKAVSESGERTLKSLDEEFPTRQ